MGRAELDALRDVAIVALCEKVPQPELLEFLDPRDRAPVVRARVEGDLQLHFAALAVEAAHQLLLGMKTQPRAHRHEVGQDQLAASGHEPGLEQVGPVEVSAPRLEGARRREREAAAAFVVEDGGEERRAVESRPAEPVDRSVSGDQRRGPAVADDRIVADGGAHALARSLLGSSRCSTTFSSNQSAWARRASASRS